jgi:AcrR family transcriptional regulator
VRKDARERRERLVQVAAEMFEGEGYGVPLEAIAERAGIGRGTLYRNFRDRSALILEVMRLRLKDLATEIERNSDDFDAFCRFLGYAGLLAALHASGRQSIESDPALAEQRAELLADANAICLTALERGKATGRIRPDLSLADVQTLARMLEGSLADVPPEERHASLARSLTLLIEGIGIAKPD